MEQMEVSEDLERDPLILYECVNKNEILPCEDNLYLDNCHDYIIPELKGQIKLTESTESRGYIIPELNGQIELTESTESRGYVWGYQETLSFLNIVEQLYGTLTTSTKRGLVWQTISRELNSIQNSSVDGHMCQRKWSNLIRSYKSVKNSKSRKTLRFQYFKEVDSILRNWRQDPEEPVQLQYTIKQDEKIIPFPEPEANEIEITNKLDLESEVEIVYLEKKSRGVQTDTPISSEKVGNSRSVRKPISYFYNLLNSQKNHYLQKERLIQRRKYKEWKEEMRATERRFQEKMALSKARLELDKKKVALFQQYLNLKLQKMQYSI